MILDRVDAYLPEAGSIDLAARLPGLFLTWAVQMQLTSAEFESEHGATLVRARYRELDPSELFIVTCAGELGDRALSEAGRTFARAHYATFAADAEQIFDGKLYTVESEWWLFERASRYLNERYLRREARPSGSLWQRLFGFGRRR